MKSFCIAAFALLLLPSLVTAQTPAGCDNPSPATPAPVSGADKPDLTPDGKGMLSQEQMQNLLRATADHDIENDKRQRDYTYIEREEQHDLDGKGRVKKTEIRTSEVLMIYASR